MKVKMGIKLSGRDVLLMHKNAPSVFSRYIYLFMEHHGCSRTEDELKSISTDELLKDMWYLGVSSDSVMHVTAIDDSALRTMLYKIKHCGVEEIDFDNLFHEYVKIRMDCDEWENV